MRGKAKEQAEIAEEKEIIDQATIKAMGKNKHGSLEQEEFQEALDKIIGEEKTEVAEAGESYEVCFKESNRYYEVDQDGNVGDYQTIIKDSNPGDITKGGNLNGESKPYEIRCIEDLVAFSKNVKEGNSYEGKKIILTRNLDFVSKFSYIDSNTTEYDTFLEGDGTKGLKKELLEGEGWMPIGSNYYADSFRGEFNGQNYVIKNMYICKERDNLGLFGSIVGGSVKNLGVTGTIMTEQNHMYVGGIVAWNDGGKIENCYSNVTINVNAFCAGGIVGMNQYGNNVTIDNCYNEGNVSNKGWPTGGLIGGVQQGSTALLMINCYNKGNVMSSYPRSVGGLIGLVNQKCYIYNSFNIGKIISKGQTGGIVGTASANLQIRNIYQSGILESTGSKGAIMAEIDDSVEINSKNVFYQNMDGETVGIYGKDDSEYNINGYTTDKWDYEKIKNDLNDDKNIVENGIDKSLWNKWTVKKQAIYFDI